MDAAKGIGCLCILSASIMTGYYLTNSLKRRWHFFREIYEILAFLEQETVLRHAVLHEALYDAAKNCRTEVRGILLYTAEAVRLRRMGNFAQDMGRSSQETARRYAYGGRTSCAV